VTMPNNPSAPIGIFDSGPGGLAVLREVRRLMPGEDVLYFGDTARQPYGPQPIESVRKYAVEITAWLAKHGAKIVIIGCNTASVAGRQAAQDCFPDLPVLGMIEPAVRAALRSSPRKRIGVWGTEITIQSKAYDQGILKTAPDASVNGQGCPELLRLAEKGQIQDKSPLRQLAWRYYQPLAESGMDTLVLGCTDLTCLRDVIDEVVGPGVHVVDPAEEVVREAQQLLQARDLLQPARDNPPHYRFTITGNNRDDFARFTAAFMDMPRVEVDQIDLQDLQRTIDPAHAGQ